MNKILEFSKKPAGIYTLWMLLWFAYCFVGIPLLSINTSGGEQKPLIYFANSIYILLYGFASISILTSFLFLKWFKKYWYLNLLVFLITGFILVSEQLFRDEYKESIYKKEYINNDEIIISIEKYTSNHKIRSERYWRNNKKDSIWTVYDKKGSIIEQKLYHNDSLLKVMK
jgi:hypothetical protein